MKVNREKKKRAIIVSGGHLELSIVLREIQIESYIIGVDKGLEFLDKHGIRPDEIVGDFDSITPSILERYRNENQIPIRTYHPEKDASDTEIAVRLAMEKGFDEIVILGATGSRIDHMWANVQVLTIPFLAGVQAWIMDENNRISLVPQDFGLKKEDAYGRYFSLFPLGCELEGLTLEGAKYSLHNHRLCACDSLSVSNEFKETEIKISYRAGKLILMETRDSCGGG